MRKVQSRHQASENASTHERYLVRVQAYHWNRLTKSPAMRTIASKSLGEKEAIAIAALLQKVRPRKGGRRQ
jgi:hypothetical protein